MRNLFPLWLQDASAALDRLRDLYTRATDDFVCANAKEWAAIDQDYVYYLDPARVRPQDHILLPKSRYVLLKELQDQLRNSYAEVAVPV